MGDAAIAAANATGQNLITQISSQNTALTTYTTTTNTLESTFTSTINGLTVPHTQGTSAAITTADNATANALRTTLASTGVADVNWITAFAIADATRTGAQAAAQAGWVTSSVQSGSSVLLWNCGDVTSSNASGSWASQYVPARTAMITTTALVDAGRQIAAWLDRTLRDNDQADADVQYIQSIAAPETQLAVAVTQRENQYATSSTNTSNDLSTDLDTSGANIQSTSAAIEKSSAVDSATAWKAYQVALASLDEGAATTAVDKAYQDALAQVTRNSRVAYANLTYTEGVAQVGSVADAITELGQAGKTHVTNLADDEKTYTDTAAPIIGARTLLYTEADNDLRKSITTADNVWRNNTAQAWGTHTAGDLVARGNVRRSLANTSNLIADASQASIAELKAQWWQNEIPNYLQWSVDIGGIETTYTNSTTANILLRTTGVKNAGITYASTVGTAIKAYETTTATARELYLSTLMTISETAAEATMRADRDKEIAVADADLQKQLTGNESAHTTAVNNANSAHSTATANAEAARKSAEQAALTQLNSTLAQATKDKEVSIAGAERLYDQTVASLDAQYGSESSNGDTGVEGATRRSAIKTRDAQYYAARDTSWANTLSGSTTLGTSPWTVKAITAANAQAAHSISRANAQAAHDAAMLDAMEDWQDATSTAFFNSLVSSSNAKRDYTNSLAGHWADWDEATDGKTGEAPDVPTESMVDSIIGILNPFDTESLEKALIDTDVPPRPQPSEIRLVYDSMGIISNHTPEEWEVINEYRARGWTWSQFWYGGERDRMKEAGFHVSSGRLHEETPPSSIPSPKLPSAPIAPVQPQPLPQPAPETETSSDYDPLDVWANARIPYITDFLAGIVKSTAGDKFLLTTSSEGLILYTVGSSIIIVGSLYIAPQACASYVTTFMFGAASAVAQYWGINALGNFINPTHNDTTVEGTLQSAIFGGLFSLPGKWFRGGCFVAGTLVQVTDDEYYDDAMPVLDESSQICQELRSSDSSLDSNVTLLSRNPISVSRPIEQVRLGQKIPALNPQWRNDGPEVEDIDSNEWVKLSLAAYRSDGAIVDVELLRPIKLVRAAEISIGTRIPFTVPELNVDGTAEVIAISDCPEISSGVGVPVTGRYITRQVDQTVRVVLRSPSGEIETVEGTAIHPIWSVDRLDWVPLGELKIGECLDGQHEAYYVESLDFIQRSTSVFNIEVHGEHVYRIGSGRILVHNSDDCAIWLQKIQAEEYISRFPIDMMRAPASSKLTSLGFPRNGGWFWRQMRDKFPYLFSPDNLKRIKNRQSPVVDDQWIIYNPQHKAFKDDLLIHHHIDQGRFASGLPEKVHQELFYFLHGRITW